MEEGLKIVLAADAADYIKQVGAAVNATGQLPEVTQQASSAVKGLGDAMNSAGQSVGSSTPKFRAFGDEAEKAGKKSGLAIFYARDAVMDLGHVARDLPYAANNIAILAGPIGKISTLMNSLKEETGSFKGALGAMAGALSGGGGLVIGLELAVSAMTLFGSKLLDTGNSAEDATDKIKDYKTLASEAAQSIVKEDVNVQSLIAVLQSENAERTKKLAAIKELKSINPEIFGQLKLEGDTVIGLTTAYKNYVDNLKTVMAAKMVQARLEDVTNKILKAEGADLTQSEKDFVASLKKSNEERKKKGELTGIQTVGDILAAKHTAELNGYYQTQAELLKQLTELQKGIIIKEPTVGNNDKPDFNFFNRFLKFDPDSVNLSAKQFAEAYETALNFATKNVNIFKGLDSIINATSEQSALKAANVWWKNFQNGIVQLKAPPITIGKDELPKLPDPVDMTKDYIETMDELQRKLGGVFDLPSKEWLKTLDDFSGKFKEFGLQLPNTIKLKNGLVIPITLANPQQLKEALQAILTDTQKRAQAVAGAVTGLLTPAFENMFKAIESGQPPLQAFFTSIGQSLEQLIAKLVATAAEAMLLSMILPGGVGGAKGFSAIFGQLMHFSQGGIVPGSGSGDTVPAMLTPGELVVPKDQVAGFLSAMKMSSGASINGGQLPSFKMPSFTMPSLSSPISNSVSARLSNSISMLKLQPIDINVSGNFRASGKDLHSAIQQTIKSQGRSF